MPMKPKDMIKLLKKYGFIVISQNGSHVKLKNPANETTVIVPLHNRDLKKGTEHQILKISGII